MSHKFSKDILARTPQDNSVENDFWSENYPKLRRYCHFLARNKWDGDDIAQETFMKALKYCHYQQKMTTALLNKIAYNHWVDLLRRRKKEKVEPQPEIANQASTNHCDETKNSVDLLIKNFTPNQAIIFLLKEGFQYQLKEIAALLNSTEMAVKANLHRAKKRLEKANEEKETSSVELFWDEEERERLSDLFYEALKNQDPSILIDAISERTRMSSVPKVVSDKLRTKPNYSPSSTLWMAA